MNYDEFNDAMNPLETVWATFYSQPRKQVIFSVAKHKPVIPFRKIINDLLASERNAPTPNTIIEALSKIKSDGSIGGECDNCSNSGWYFARDSDNYATRCECVGGPQALIRSLERENAYKNDAMLGRLIQSVKQTFINQ